MPARRILVVGGTGYYGSLAARVLGRLPDVSVAIASRRPGRARVLCDLADPATLAAFDDFDLVVNCADSVGAAPDLAIRRCLASGPTFVDMGADPAGVLRALDAHRPRTDGRGGPVPARGVVVVGAGVFPGLSTIFARAVADAAGRPERIEVAVHMRPLSGAGRGNCALMVRLLGAPAISYDAALRVERPPVGRAERFTFPRIGARAAIEIGLPDALLLHSSTGIPSIATYMAFSPSWLRHSFRVLARLTPAGGALRSAYLGAIEWGLRFSRALLLRRVSTPVRVSVRVQCGGAAYVERGFAVRNGQLAAAVGVAALAGEVLAAREGLAPGLYGPDEVCAWTRTAARARELGGDALGLESDPVAFV